MGPLDEIASFLRAGQKVNAIKVYREVTGASLSDAKAAVERMELAIRLYGTQVFVNALSEVAQLASTTDMDIQSVLLAEMAYLISQDQKIQAIKPYRERTGLGLADAKNVVDRIELMIVPKNLIND